VNGIWLCGICAKLVDSDVSAYPEALLRDWKETAEATALLEIKGLKVVPDKRALLRKLEGELTDSSLKCAAISKKILLFESSS
jgi:hypothetical protein